MATEVDVCLEDLLSNLETDLLLCSADSSVSAAGPATIENFQVQSVETCAICLGEIPLQDTAVLKGCEHSYCVACILNWVTYHKENPRCPQCKAEFNYLYTYRFLDGSLCDHFVEECVTLLLRARWFQGKAPIVEQAEEVEEEDFIDYGEDDEEYLEEHYSRVVLGNRRFGGSGFMSSGRACARPVQPRLVHRPAHDAESSRSRQKSSAPSPSAKKAQREAKKQQKQEKEADKRAKRAARRAEDASTARTRDKPVNNNEAVTAESQTVLE